MNQFIYTLLFVLGFIGILIFSELLYRRHKIKVEHTRKLAHSVACLSSLFFLLVFKSTIYVIIMGLLFFLILFIGKKYHFFHSIDKIERKSAGSYLLPVSIGLMFYTSKVMANELIFLLPILILGVSDPLAGLSGSFRNQSLQKIIVFNKTLEKTYFGSGLFFISSLILSLVVFCVYQFPLVQTLLMAVVIALISTIVELLSTRGFDNITIPAAVALLIHYLV